MQFDELILHKDDEIEVPEDIKPVNNGPSAKRKKTK